MGFLSVPIATLEFQHCGAPLRRPKGRLVSAHFVQWIHAASGVLETYSASVVIEFGSKGTIGTCHSTARVLIRLVITVLVLNRPGFLSLDAHGASTGCMEGCLVSKGSAVGGLDDIDLSVLGPVARVCEPQRRPRSASVRGVENVKNKQTVRVGVVRRDSDRLAATGSLGST